MSTPDSQGESLESILASIRRSLAEQSTGVLDEGSVAASDAPDEDMRAEPVSLDLDAPPVPHSLSHQLAGPVSAPAAPTSGGPLKALLDAASAAEEAASASAIAATVPPAAIAAVTAPTAEVSQASAPAPAPFAAHPSGREPASAEPAQVLPAEPIAVQPADSPKDPLWFLGLGAESAETGTPVSAPAAPTPAAPTVAAGAPLPSSIAAGAVLANPKPAGAETKARTGIVRGPLPPFFGSSVEAVDVEIAPEPPPLAAPVLPMGPSPTVAPAAANGAAHGGGFQEPPPGWPHSLGGAVNGNPAPVASVTPADDGPADGGRAFFGESLPQTQALEIMVAELLRPMLRRWLDENMPRLVSAALKAELAERGRKKS